jgi:hypothetical protein
MNNLADVDTVLKRASELESTESWEEVISFLTQRNRQEENVQIESRLIKARHQAFLAQADSARSESWPESVADMFPDELGLPEIQVSELTAEVLASAIQHHGSLLVRGLVSEEDAENIRQAIDATLEARASLGEQISDKVLPWYIPYKARGSALLVDRELTKGQDVALTVDAPRILFRQLEALNRTGLIDTVKEYFGESVALSAKKSTVRRTPPGAPTGWHQDGLYWADNTRTLNIWTAYSPCGVDAASLDVVNQALTELIQPDEGQFFDQSIRPETVAATFGEESIVRPVFNIGDGIIFDDLTLHRTGIDGGITKPRDAIEMWLFAASTFPDNQLPLCV